MAHICEEFAFGLVSYDRFLSQQTGPLDGVLKLQVGLFELRPGFFRLLFGVLQVVFSAFACAEISNGGCEETQQLTLLFGYRAFDDSVVHTDMTDDLFAIPDAGEDLSSLPDDPPFVVGQRQLAFKNKGLFAQQNPSIRGIGVEFGFLVAFVADVSVFVHAERTDYGIGFIGAKPDAQAVKP